MLTKVQAYSSWDNAQEMLLSPTGREETDLIQVVNIDGLTPVKASVSTTPYGSIDGSQITGTRVDSRNIVITLRPNPDWVNWTHESLRKFLYKYFMPKMLTRLVFTSDDVSPPAPVEIYGYVEDFGANPFSKDPEYVVSIICPDPYFTAIDPTIVTGSSTNGTVPLGINYPGDIEIGFNLTADRLMAPTTFLKTVIGDSYFEVAAAVDTALRYIMNSVAGAKYVKMLDMNSGVETSLMGKIQLGSEWPILRPGVNDFALISDNPGDVTFILTYFARYGGL